MSCALRATFDVKLQRYCSVTATVTASARWNHDGGGRMVARVGRSRARLRGGARSREASTPRGETPISRARLVLAGLSIRGGFQAADDIAARRDTYIDNNIIIIVFFSPPPRLIYDGFCVATRGSPYAAFFPSFPLFWFSFVVSSITRIRILHECVCG